MARGIKKLWKYIKTITWEITLSWFIKDGKLHKLRTVVTLLTFYVFLILIKKYQNQEYCTDEYALGLVSGVIGGIFIDVFHRKGKRR